MIDIFQEIWSAIGRNKLRTALTGFAVAWGIFILIVLLGAGNGLINAFLLNANEQALNSVKVYPGVTSIAYEGFDKGRWVGLEERDLHIVANSFPDIVGEVSAQLSSSETRTICYKQDYTTAMLMGFHPAQERIEKVKMVKGRYINEIDIEKKRKVVVLSDKAEEILWKKGENPLGEYVSIDGFSYKVVGIYEVDRSMGFDNAVIPFTTMQVIYSKGLYLDNYVFTTNGLNSVEANDAFEAQLRKKLGEAHKFDPTDNSAVYFWNRMTQYLQTQTGNAMLNTALWVIGLFTLVSGIVGVSNIMLITVKERTREFGIRKALGAKPRQILSLVMAESIVITTLFGYCGMVAGIGVTELANFLIGNSVMDNGVGSASVFTNPTVDLSTAISATLTLVIAGTIAGFIPARKAVSIRPIEALRAD